MADNNNKFSCLIIGAGSLLIRCAEILLLDGHTINAIVTADHAVRSWAAENAISTFPPQVDVNELSDRPVDYLFSIVNEHILGEDVLSLPRELAINYHDGPLPRYAGTHATSWALMNGENDHAITWHIISNLVDAGDILKQEPVTIEKSDTAFTLNTKCFEAAIVSFQNLVQDLAAKRAIHQKQNLDDRTFYPRFKRPKNGGVIIWDRPADEISALVRSLDFGGHPNPLGTAKILIENDFFLVTKVQALDTLSPSPAGSINEIGHDYLRVSCSDKEIKVSGIQDLCGETVAITDLLNRFRLDKLYQLPKISAETASKIEEFYQATCRHEQYWINKLASSEPIEPPSANVAIQRTAVKYSSVPLRIPNELFAGLKDMSAQVVLTAFGAFLARLNDVDTFDFGYKDFGINDATLELEKIAAPQVPFRFEIDRLKNFAEVIDGLRAEFESVNYRKTYSRDLIARSPLLSGKKFTLPVAVAIVGRLDDRTGTHDSDLLLQYSLHESDCRLLYNQVRFRKDDIDRLAAKFEFFLNNIVADPGCKLAYIPLLTEGERHQLLVEWNMTSIEWPREKCIHHFFEKQVIETPDAVALIFGDERLTYRELNRRANQTAHYLQSLGVGAEMLVAICLDRSVEMIIGILGILKAGGAYVPLDPAYPKDRLEHILSDSQASVLLTSKNLADGVNGASATVVCIDTELAKISRHSDDNPASKVASDNLAYVIYTSGSTGKPKGVAIEHRSTVALLSWAATVFSLEQLRGTLASTSVCFDLSVYEMFAPLSCGGKIILVENILHLGTTPAAEEVTLINTVPSAITQLVRTNGIPASVRTINLAGEPLRASLVRELYEIGTIQKIYDLYGPSEDTTYSTFALRDINKESIGRPISNTKAYILDSYFQPVPVGFAGELYLGGDGLAREYLHQPKMTSERFVRNPFEAEPASRLYKTGDLVRYLASSEIEYLGRIDHQVKIRGFRIELGEIENVLALHSSIKEAVVIAREDQPGEKRLAAYFVCVQDATVTVTDLRNFLKKTLPDYMIPTAFVELSSIPLTPNGKIDKRALPVPSSTLADNDGNFLAHRDELESKLTEIWERILRVQPIGVQDNFFELGGHSLLAVRMFAEVEETFGKNIPLATLFEAGTIEQLADILRQEGWAEKESSLVAIQPYGSKPNFFCVHAKGGNVLFYRDLATHLGPDQPFYGLQARRLGGRQLGHGTVEEMAEYYIKEIRKIQPNGPYFLGGSSFGGLGAFEMAQQLVRQGEEVSLLALFDTGTPDYPKLLPNTTGFRARIYTSTRRIQHHLATLRAFNTSEKTDYIIAKLNKTKLKYQRRVRNTLKRSVRQFYARTAGKESIPTNYIQLEDQIWRAGLQYKPVPYTGKLTLFRASHQPLGIYPDPTLGWKELVKGELEIHEVPGHHGSIVAEPYVRALAEQLGQCLEKASIKENCIRMKLPFGHSRNRWRPAV